MMVPHKLVTSEVGNLSEELKVHKRCAGTLHTIKINPCLMPTEFIRPYYNITSNDSIAGNG